MISNRWKIIAAALPIIGTLALAQPQPGGLGGFFSAYWWGIKEKTYFPLNQLVAYYSMNTSGNLVLEPYSNLDGTASNGVLFSTSYGVIEDGASFDGVDDVIVLPNDDALEPRTNNFSVSFLMYAIGGSMPDLISNRNLGLVGSQPGFVIGASGDNASEVLYFLLDDGSSNYMHRGLGPAYTSNTWTHFVMTWEKSSQSLLVYKNGVDVTSQYALTSLGTVNDVNSANAVQFSGRPNTTARDFQGYLDEVLFYSRVLTSNEVFDIYGAYGL